MINTNRDAMIATNLFVFLVAAVLEIAGCFAFWLWLRRGSSPLIALMGVLSLIGFAFMLTQADTVFAGRAYAAYGGIYIATSLAWLWIAEGQRPSVTDLLGAAIAIGGAIVIVGMADKTP
jgi:small multidrug resistance family-3 protein